MAESDALSCSLFKSSDISVGGAPPIRDPSNPDAVDAAVTAGDESVSAATLSVDSDSGMTVYGSSDANM
jgi:hypothetical protein